MAEPLATGMPAKDTDVKVLRPNGKDAWGRIRFGGPCKDDYFRIQIYHQDAQRYVKLQRAAIASLQAAEEVLNAKIYVTGSWRSCSLQAKLRRSDPKRFADPNTTAHCRGLAIDVSQNQTAKKLAKIDRELRIRHWHQARTDEPWHYSFGIQV